MEYSMERKLGECFKKFWHLTNHGRGSTGKDTQLATLVHEHQVVSDLAHHGNIRSCLHVGARHVDETYAEVDARMITVKLTSKTFPVDNTGRTKYQFENQFVYHLVRRQVRENVAGMVGAIVVADSMVIPIHNLQVKPFLTHKLEGEPAEAVRNTSDKHCM